MHLNWFGWESVCEAEVHISVTKPFWNVLAYADCLINTVYGCNEEPSYGQQYD